MSNQSDIKRDPRELQAGEYAYLGDSVAPVSDKNVTENESIGITFDDLDKPCKSLCDDKTCVCFYKEISIC